jgi:hypothetical protein
VIGAEIVISVVRVGQQMPGDHQDGAADGDDCLGLAAAVGDAPVAGPGFLRIVNGAPAAKAASATANAVTAGTASASTALKEHASGPDVASSATTSSRSVRPSCAELRWCLRS